MQEFDYIENKEYFLNKLDVLLAEVENFPEYKRQIRIDLINHLNNKL